MYDSISQGYMLFFFLSCTYESWKEEDGVSKREGNDTKDAWSREYLCCPLPDNNSPVANVVIGSAEEAGHRLIEARENFAKVRSNGAFLSFW